VPIELALYAATATVIGAAWHSVLIGKAGRIRSANKKFLRIFYVAALRLLAEHESQDQ
jgi:hypothetical protein